MTRKDNDQIVLIQTGESFQQHAIAEEWIRELAPRAKRYVILEVIEAE